MKIICPECGSPNVLPVVYGCPTEESMKRMRDGEITLGGCKGRKENSYCKDCHSYFVTSNVRIEG